MKTDYRPEHHFLSPLSDCNVARCPDIIAFHVALNRVFRADHNFAGERHPFYELVYVADGTVGITAEDEIYTLNKGQFFLHPPNEFHRIWSEEGSTPHVVNISFHAAAMPTCPSRVVQLREAEQEELLRICDAVQIGLRSSDRTLLNEQRLCMELWLLHVMKNSGEVAKKSSSPTALHYAGIVNVLRTHLKEPLSAAEIAQLCNISLSSLKKIFTRYAGMGVSRYFTEMKMRYAAEQLREGKRVGEIAAELGYYDQNYFSTAFRRTMGVSPGSVRASDRKQPMNTKENITKENFKMKFITVDSYEKLSRQAANILAAQITLKPQSVLGLATGSSPVGMYRELIERYNNGDLDFSEITSVNLDEYVGLDGSSDQSYRYFMQKHLFDHVNIRPECTFVPNGTAENLDKECAEYDARIKRLGGIDLQVLGIGLDGHIGFNEPGDCFVNETHVIDLHESTIRANARFFANENEVPKQAVTMGMAAIMQAKKIVLIANGKAKGEVLQQAFHGPVTPMLPASILQLHPDLTVIYTEADA